jgi:hypothetical protein
MRKCFHPFSLLNAELTQQTFEFISAAVNQERLSAEEDQTATKTVDTLNGQNGVDAQSHAEVVFRQEAGEIHCTLVWF